MVVGGAAGADNSGEVQVGGKRGLHRNMHWWVSNIAL